MEPIVISDDSDNETQFLYSVPKQHSIEDYIKPTIDLTDEPTITKTLDTLYCLGMIRRLAYNVSPKVASFKTLIPVTLETRNNMTALVHQQWTMGYLDPLLDTAVRSMPSVTFNGYMSCHITNEYTSSFRLLLYGSKVAYNNVVAQLNSMGFLLEPPDVQTAVPYVYQKLRFQPYPTHTVKKVTGSVESQIQSIYHSLTESHDLPLAEPLHLKTNLYKHQKQALYFMMNREKPPDYSVQGSKRCLWLKCGNGYKNIITDTTSTQPPSDSRGGILADDMGLGKTIEVIALITSTQIDTPVKPSTRSATPSSAVDLLKQRTDPFGFVSSPPTPTLSLSDEELVPSCSTLIVCPLSLISNWEDQIQEHTLPGTLSTLIYHGPGRTHDPHELVKYDVIITTYALLSRNSALSKIYWYRIILDEAHYIKSPSTNQAKAACELQGLNRWCLTGTPIQNRLEDVFSLIKFLNFEPFNTKATWQIYLSFKDPRKGSVALARLQTLMKAVTLRRVKDQLLDGKPILSLPPKEEVIHYIQLTSEEEKVYNSVHQRVLQTLQEYRSKNGSYINILEGILRMRQACVHINLVNKPQESDEFTPQKAFDLYLTLASTDQDQCNQCSEALQGDISVFICSHMFCSSCSPSCCSVCQVSTCQVVNTGAHHLSLTGSSTKIEALMAELECLTEKCIIFSQWTQVLDLLQIQLNSRGYKYLRLDGSLSRKARLEVIQEFSNNPEATIFLMSIKAGGVGLNLTAASRVFIMDPYWNPQVEAQAIDRVHRLGQTLAVKAIRFIAKGTIEEKMLELQQKKLDIAKATLKDPRETRIAQLNVLLS